jgi:heptosyltransferase III
MLTKGNAGFEKVPKRALLIQLGDIGDVVLSFPCARALSEHFPELSITMVVRHKAGDLVNCCPWVDETLWVDDTKKPVGQFIIDQTKFFRSIRQKHYDLAIDLRAGTRGAILGFLSGATKRIGFFAEGEKFWRNLLFSDLASPPPAKNQHMAQYYASLLSEFGVSTNNPWPQMVVPKNILHQVGKRLKSIRSDPKGPLVVIQPFSLWPYKEWGDEKFIELIHRIDKTNGPTVIITGAASEQSRAAVIVEKATTKTFNWAGQTTLAQLAALLKHADIFVGLDSAGMHIAAAMGTSAVTIFGPSSSSDWAPRGERHTAISPDRDCAPCFKMGCDGSRVSQCLLDLSVTRVFKTVIAHIGSARC